MKVGAKAHGRVSSFADCFEAAYDWNVMSLGRLLQLKRYKALNQRLPDSQGNEMPSFFHGSEHIYNLPQAILDSKDERDGTSGTG